MRAHLLGLALASYSLLACSDDAGASAETATTATSDDDAATATGVTDAATATDAVAEPDTSAGTLPRDDLAFGGAFAPGLEGYGEATLTVDGVERLVGAYVPSARGAHPPLVVALHGTSGTPSGIIEEAGLAAFAEAHGVVLVAPQARERNGGQGESGDPDHYAGSEGWYGTSWNLASDDDDANDDARLVRAAIQAARDAWGVDPDHVYALGHSNGAFFAYHVAVLLRGRIAAFAENAGGAVRCANKDAPGPQFTGDDTTCAALAQRPGYPTCDGPLEPSAPGAHPPWGFLAHHPDDDVVSVAWTCTLAAALGDHAEVFLRAPDDESHGHSVVSGFAERAWAFLARHSRE